MAIIREWACLDFEFENCFLFVFCPKAHPGKLNFVFLISGFAQLRDKPPHLHQNPLSCGFMTGKRILRYVLTGLSAIFILLLLFTLISIAPVNRTPAKDHASYEVMVSSLEKLDSVVVPAATHTFRVGYAKVKLTPATATTSVSHGPRRETLSNGIRDSISVRALVIDNGTEKVAIVSADLLIIPPAVTELLEDKLAGTAFSLNNTYLGATHTHNSIGNWGEGASRFIYGPYKAEIVEFIADRIVSAIREAEKNAKPAILKTGLIPVPHAVSNRLVRGGPEDPNLRVLEIHRSDSSKLLFMSYTAHPTCLYSKGLRLSRDYPGQLVDTIEKNGYAFAMFMAGAVGSHMASPPAGAEVCVDWMATEISETFLSERHRLVDVTDTSLLMMRVPFLLSDPQVKITPDWKVRSWVFRAALGEYPVYLTALRIGNIVMLGTPCDFSGEFSASLDSLASQKDLSILVTSFNGGYIGYVTPVNRYDVNHYETQLMNWYAPGTGEYMKECLKRLVEIVQQ